MMGLTDKAIIKLGELAAETPLGKAAIKASENLAKDVIDSIMEKGASTNKISSTKTTLASSRKTTIIQVSDVPHQNPEVVRAQEFQTQSSENAAWNITADSTKQRFKAFAGKKDVDVVVVGGGVVGLQTAHELGSHGINTLLLEKDLVGTGTSRFMGAMNTYAEDAGFGAIKDIHGEEGFAKRLQSLIQSRTDVQQLAKRYKANFQDVHSYNVSYEANDPALKSEVDLLHRAGDQSPHLLGEADAAKIFAPAKSAVVFPHEGNLNPYKFSLGLADSGKFIVHEKSPVLGIGVGAPGEGVQVFTPGGTINARKVVFATNGPAPMFNSLNDHLTPVQCFAVNADICSKLPGNFFDADSTAFTYWRQFGVKPFGSTETLVGGSARFLNKDIAAENAPKLEERVKELFPNAKPPSKPVTALIFSSYSDGLPVAGAHPLHPDVWTATGSGGTGLVNGNWIGRTIREQLKKQNIENLISPDRFGH